MKNIFLLILFFFLSSFSKAQYFEKDNFVLSAGIGGPNMQKSIIRLMLTFEDDYKITGQGVYHGKFEYAVIDQLGLGLSMNYSSAKMVATEKDFFDPSIIHTHIYELSSIKFNLRANYHFNLSDKFDTYAGLGLGYGITNYKYTSTDTDDLNEDISIPFAIGLEATVGLRYYPKKRLGFYTELGISKSILQGGFVYKI